MDGSADVEHRWVSAPDFIGQRHELREKLLLNLFLAAVPGRRVLNVGAGQGSFTRLLEARGYDVVSSDVSPGAVDVLRDKVGGEVVEADMTELPFPGSSFDAVVAGEVIEHIEDDRRALLEAARVLRPGGVLALSVCTSFGSRCRSIVSSSGSSEAVSAISRSLGYRPPSSRSR